MTTQNEAAMNTAAYIRGYEDGKFVAAAELRRLEAANAELLKAGQSLLDHTETAHRPPVRDRIEAGRMAAVRVHALADLHAAIEKHGGQHA